MINQWTIPEIHTALLLRRPLTPVTSQYLATFHIAERLFFDIHAEANQRDVRDFYTNNLCEISDVAAGSLLRDWSLIPGRDLSPNRRRAVTLITATKSDEMFLSAENNVVDENDDDIFVSAKSVQSQEEVCFGNNPNVYEDVVNTSEIELPKCVTNESDKSSVNIDAVFDIHSDSDSDEIVQSNLPENPSLNDFDINYSQKHSSLDQPVTTTGSISKPNLSQRGCTRSPSPDMFADDDDSEGFDDDDSQHELLSDSDNPPCSLDPLSSSSGSSNPRMPTEEDCIIEMYATGAILLNDSKRTSTSLTCNVNPENQSSDTPMQLNYSGLSDKSMSATTPNNFENDNPIEKANNDLDLHVSIKEQNDELDERNVELSQSGIMVFESYTDNGKCNIDVINYLYVVVTLIIHFI